MKSGINYSNTPEFIVMHYSQSGDRAWYSIEEINNDHRRKGFYPYITPNGRPLFIGYHYLVNRLGCVSTLRPENIFGQHCASMNRKSIGICVEGLVKVLDQNTKKPTLELVYRLMKKYQIPVNRVVGHGEIDNKDCPNFRRGMSGFRETLVNFINKIDPDSKLAN